MSLASNIKTDVPLLERRSHEERSASQDQQLHHLLTSTIQYIPYYQKAFANIDLSHIHDRKSLELLPIIRKDSLIELQANAPPFGGHLPDGLKEADYLFASPGPIYEPGFMNAEYWSVVSALQAANFTEDDVIFNTFSYHLTPGAWIFDSGARAIGCPVIPVGSAPRDLQIQALDHYRPTAYCGTPDYLKQLISFVETDGTKPLSIKKAMVSGGALTPSLREFFDEKNVEVLQCYATAEVGVIAYESPARDGLIVNEDVILEIIDPDTGKSQPPGLVGEVVVTKLRGSYPLIRFGTGDLSCLVEGDSPCGRTSPRIQGWLGRADMTTKIKGMFVRPTQINSLVSQLPVLERARLIVDRDNDKDKSILHCELSPAEIQDRDEDEIENLIGQKFRDLCHIRASISVVPLGTLPDDGKIIVDLR
ncbi:MAG: AMP-binding protein [Hyphomicrobiales bacterium]